MLIAQISDCHIVDRGELFADRVDSSAGLRAAVDTINALGTPPDVVLATGDLVNDGTPSQYDHLLDLLSGLRCPVLPLPGNHDDRTELRARFTEMLPPGAPEDPIDYTFEDGPVRIIALDTTIPGRHDGRLLAEQLAWLDRELAEQPGRPTIVAQHHPPVSSGVRWMDDTSGFPDGDREAAIIGRHRNVEAVVSGHLHRAFHRRFAGTIAVTCPSSASQLALDLRDAVTKYTAEPTGLLLHHWRDGHGLVSHVVPLGTFDTWSPSWAT